MQEKLLLNSFNCRGLGEGRKRREVFQWLKKYHPGIVLLQETHSTVVSEKRWEQEWGGEIYFCHGTSNARGVAILFPKMSNFIVDKITKDDNGRFLLMDIRTEDWNITLGNIYAPTKDKQQDQTEFINYIFENFMEYADKNIVIGGDFNVCLNPNLDKSGGAIEPKSHNAQVIENFCEQLNLNDIWRTINPLSKRF